MNLYAAAFLLPVGVMFYTAQGGLKASYVASWANTGAAQVIKVYNNNDDDDDDDDINSNNMLTRRPHRDDIPPFSRFTHANFQQSSFVTP
jgi:hypothetical protein